MAGFLARYFVEQQSAVSTQPTAGRGLRHSVRQHFRLKGLQHWGHGGRERYEKWKDSKGYKFAVFCMARPAASGNLGGADSSALLPPHHAQKTKARVLGTPALAR